MPKILKIKKKSQLIKSLFQMLNELEYEFLLHSFTR